MAEDTKPDVLTKPPVPVVQAGETDYTPFAEAMKGIIFDEKAYREALGLSATAALFGMTAWALLTHLCENDREPNGYVATHGHDVTAAKAAKWIPKKFPVLETIKVVISDILDAGSIAIEAVFNGKSLVRVVKVTMLKGKVLDDIYLVKTVAKGGIDGSNMKYAEERIRAIVELYADKLMFASSENAEATETTPIAIIALRKIWIITTLTPILNWLSERFIEGEIQPTIRL